MGLQRMFGWTKQPPLNAEDLRAIRALEIEAALMATRREEAAAVLASERAELVSLKRRAARWSLMFLAVSGGGTVAASGLWAVHSGAAEPNVSLWALATAGWTELRRVRASPVFDNPWLLGTIAGFILTAFWSLRSEGSERPNRQGTEALAAEEQFRTTIQLCLVGCVPAALVLAVPPRGTFNAGVTGVFLVLAWLSAIVTWHMTGSRSGRKGYGPVVEAELRYSTARAAVLRRCAAVAGLATDRWGTRQWAILTLEICIWPGVASVAGLLMTPHPDLFLLCAGAMTLTIGIVFPTLMYVVEPDRHGRWLLPVAALLLCPYVLVWPGLAWLLWRLDAEPILITAGLCGAVVYARGRYRRLAPAIQLSALPRSTSRATR